jgi:hypothetical protein
MIDLVTVAYKQNIQALKTQARSISKYFSPDEINTIHVAVNDSPDYDKHIVNPDWYENFSDRVQIWTPQELGWNQINLQHGWHRQQLLKILVAAKSHMTWTLILDDKTWFVKNYNNQLAFSDNKPRVTLGTTPALFQAGKKFLENLLGIQPIRTINPQGTPMFWHTDMVRAMLHEPKFGGNIIDFYERYYSTPDSGELLVTEFVLYSVYLQYLVDFDRLYHADYSQLDPIDLDYYGLGDDFDLWLHDLVTGKSDPMTVGLNHRHMINLEPYQLNNWQRYLQSKDLIN